MIARWQRWTPEWQTIVVPVSAVVLGDTHDTYLVSRYQIFTIPVSWRPRYLLVSRYPRYRGTLDDTNYETHANICVYRQLVLHQRGSSALQATLWRPDVTVWPQKMLICWPSWPKTCRRSICILYSYILCFVNKIYITHIIGSSYDVELEFACILIKFYTVAWLIDWLVYPHPLVAGKRKVIIPR
jgi:hypothetical protein